MHLDMLRHAEKLLAVRPHKHERRIDAHPFLADVMRKLFHQDAI